MVGGAGFRGSSGGYAAWSNAGWCRGARVFLHPETGGWLYTLAEVNLYETLSRGVSEPRMVVSKLGLVVPNSLIRCGFAMGDARHAQVLKDQTHDA